MQKKTGMGMMLMFATMAFTVLAGVIPAALSEGAATAAGVTGANGDEVNIVLIFAVIIIVVVVVSFLWWLLARRKKK